MEIKANPQLHDLYPNLKEPELAAVEDSLDQYLQLVLQIFERTHFQTYPQATQLTQPAGTLTCTYPKFVG